MKGSKVELTPPMGVVPEGKQVGDDFDLVCTFRVEQGGRCCLTTMGNTPMPGYDGGETETKPNYGDMAKSMAESGAMGGY